MEFHTDFKLIGETAMVSPDVVDAVGINQAGLVASLSPENNMVLLQFADGCQGEFNKEELLMLLPHKHVLKWLQSNKNSPDYKCVAEVSRLMSQNRMGEAIELAYKDPVTLSLCTTDFISWQNNVTKKKTKNTKRLYKGPKI